MGTHTSQKLATKILLQDNGNFLSLLAGQAESGY